VGFRRPNAAEDLLMIRRREFIAGLGGAAVWPLVARAQQPTKRVIGVLGSTSRVALEGWFRPLESLRDAGFVEGRNLTIEYRFAEGNLDRLPTLAADLVHLGVDVIFTTGTPGALAAKGATTEIPVVFAIGGDPVQRGLVASLSRPGGNLTGFTGLADVVAAKRVELLHELMPSAKRIALLVNPAAPVNAQDAQAETEAAARFFGLEVIVLKASTYAQFAPVIAGFKQTGADALVIGANPLFSSGVDELGELVLRHRVPAIYAYHGFVAAGGLMGYGSNDPNVFSQVGTYLGRILKGDKPADLPVQLVTKVELIINLRTAKALGLTFPLTLLARADEVIE
jgi:putative ABC transport system substrate-binding protein